MSPVNNSGMRTGNNGVAGGPLLMGVDGTGREEHLQPGSLLARSGGLFPHSPQRSHRMSLLELR